MLINELGRAANKNGGEGEEGCMASHTRWSPELGLMRLYIESKGELLGTQHLDRINNFNIALGHHHFQSRMALVQ